MNHLKRYLTVFVVACLIAVPASGATVYLQYWGQNGAGDINGTAFSDVDWMFEVRINTAVTDANPDPIIGEFAGAVTAAYLTIDSSPFPMEITSSSIDTVNFFNYNSLAVSLGPTTDASLATGAGGIFPTVLTDHNDLSTLIGATTTDNSTANFLSVPSLIDFSSAISKRADVINLVDASPSGAGTMTMTTSVSRVSVPEPGWELLAGFPLFIGLILRRRIV